jgi:hypothetical protein
MFGSDSHVAVECRCVGSVSDFGKTRGNFCGALIYVKNERNKRLKTQSCIHQNKTVSDIFGKKDLLICIENKPSTCYAQRMEDK